jgi:hypothetical protein
MVACIFIGNFTPHMLCDILHVSILLSFYLSVMPSLPPATLSEHRLVCFFCGSPPCYKRERERRKKRKEGKKEGNEKERKKGRKEN